MEFIKIAIYGKAKSGKDTFANLLMNEFEKKLPSDELIFHTAFAEPIKRFVWSLFPGEFSQTSLFGPSQNRENKILGTELSYRQLLCDMGELLKKYDPDIWINKTFQTIDDKIKETQRVIIKESSWQLSTSFIKGISYQPVKTRAFIISDLRFKREYEALKTQNYFLIKLIRPDNDYFSNHCSETELETLPNNCFDYTVVNDKSVHDMEDKVREIITLLGI